MEFQDNEHADSDCFEYVDTSKLPAKRKLKDIRAHINRENWNKKVSAALIAQVKLYPGLFLPYTYFVYLFVYCHFTVIWDVNSTNFRKKRFKESAWKKVRTNGNLMHIPDAECRRKWQHLSNNYYKLSRAYYDSTTPKKKPNWEHWNAMEFINKNRPSYSMSIQSNLVCFEIANSYCFFFSHTFFVHRPPSGN